ncbi:MAG: hypothetical protein M3395_00220 [Chloroflexota bacterium]|nr:hypothetical protein [Chloroflexota bacterium]
MDRLTLALTVAFVVIGVVMAGVWALVRFLPRAMVDPPSARTQRRVGYAMIAGGLLYLVILPLLAAAGSDVGRLLFYLVQGGLFLAWGIWTVRQHREGRRGDTTDAPLARTAQGEEVRTATPPSDGPKPHGTTPMRFMGREFRLGSSDWYRRLEASGERHPVFVGLFVLAVVLAFGLLMTVSMISRLTQGGS